MSGLHRKELRLTFGECLANGTRSQWLRSAEASRTIHEPYEIPYWFPFPSYLGKAEFLVTNKRRGTKLQNIVQFFRFFTNYPRGIAVSSGYR